MIQWTLMIMLFMFNFIFINMKHPLAMGLILLIQTTLVCLTSGFMNQSFWFSYILFLVFLGGMLVLFIYVTSLASNEMFTFSMKLMMLTIIIFIYTAVFLMLVDKNFLIQNSVNMMKSIIHESYSLTENSLSLNKLFNYPTNMMTIMLMNYLLITLIVVVKITKLFKGPLRHMTN